MAKSRPHWKKGRGKLGPGGFHWVVEAKNEKGWKRFTEHHGRPA